MSRTLAIMSPERMARLTRSFEEVAAQPRALASLFYQELFSAAPGLRPLVPADMTSRQGHVEAALALVIRNLDDLAALQDSLRELGVAHVHWGAKLEEYAIVRGALIRAIRTASSSWSDDQEADWRRAITAIAVPMPQGAAVHTAVIAAQMADDLPGGNESS